MEKIPNSVRQRLAAQQREGGHPDADLLGAFAEQRLSGSERDGVLAHLSGCSDCREIVAISSNAAPEISQPSFAETSSGPRRWWAIPAFQWGAAAAALAMVAVGLLILQPRQNSEQVARNATYNAPATRAQSSGASDESRSHAQQDGAVLNDSAKPDRRARVLRPGETPSFTHQAKRVPAAPAAAQSAVPEDVAVAKDLSKSERSDREVARSEMTEQQQAAGQRTTQAFSQSVEVTGSAAPVEAAQNSAAVTGVAGGRTAIMQERSAAAPSKGSTSAASTSPVLSVTPMASTAAKTADNKKQEVVLSQSHAADELATGRAGGAVKAQRTKMAMEASVTASPWRIAHGRLQHFDGTRAVWDDVDIGTTARLSIVATLGSEVWVGGTAGAMFYSNDQGAHWIPTSTGGWSKDATITALTPTALRSVEVFLSNGERWRSADGGASWARYQ